MAVLSIITTYSAIFTAKTCYVPSYKYTEQFCVCICCGVVVNVRGHTFQECTSFFDTEQI